MARPTTTRKMILKELERADLSPEIRVQYFEMLVKLKTKAPNPKGNQIKLRKPGVRRAHSLTPEQEQRIKRNNPPPAKPEPTLIDFLSAPSPSEQMQEQLEPLPENGGERFHHEEKLR